MWGPKKIQQWAYPWFLIFKKWECTKEPCAGHTHTPQKSSAEVKKFKSGPDTAWTPQPFHGLEAPQATGGSTKPANAQHSQTEIQPGSIFPSTQIPLVDLNPHSHSEERRQSEISQCGPHCATSQQFSRTHEPWKHSQACLLGTAGLSAIWVAAYTPLS